MTALLGLIAGLAITLGPVVALMWLLHLRDGRESLVRLAALKHVSSRETRGLIAIQVRSALLLRRSVVTIDMWACSREQIWDTLARLGRDLPPRVRLIVDGSVDPQLTARFTLETSGRLSLCRPSRTSVAAS